MKKRKKYIFATGQIAKINESKRAYGMATKEFVNWLIGWTFTGTGCWPLVEVFKEIMINSVYESILAAKHTLNCCSASQRSLACQFIHSSFIIFQIYTLSMDARRQACLSPSLSFSVAMCVSECACAHNCLFVYYKSMSELLWSCSLVRYLTDGLAFNFYRSFVHSSSDIFLFFASFNIFVLNFIACTTTASTNRL